MPFQTSFKTLLNLTLLQALNTFFLINLWAFTSATKFMGVYFCNKIYGCLLSKVNEPVNKPLVFWSTRFSRFIVVSHHCLSCVGKKAVWLSKTSFIPYRGHCKPSCKHRNSCIIKSQEASGEYKIGHTRFISLDVYSNISFCEQCTCNLHSNSMQYNHTLRLKLLLNSWNIVWYIGSYKVKWKKKVVCKLNVLHNEL